LFGRLISFSHFSSHDLWCQWVDLCRVHQAFREAHNHEVGTLQGRLASEVDSRTRAETQLSQVERQVRQQATATDLLAVLRTQVQEEKVARRDAEARADRVEAQIAGKLESQKVVIIIIQSDSILNHLFTVMILFWEIASGFIASA
jgi:acetyl-CoA carboxylase beta subunit